MTKTKSVKKNLLGFLIKREVILILTIGVVLLVASNTTEKFFTALNSSGILFNISIYTIIACAVTVLILSGSFDISIGPFYSVAVILFGTLVGGGINIYLAIVLTIVVGIIIGTIIGLIITKLKINAFLVTLATLFLFESLAWIITMFGSMEGRGLDTQLAFRDFPESFLRISGGTIFGIEYINIYMIAIMLFFHFFLTRNKFFRQSYFLGGNINSAKLLGIKTDKVLIINHAMVSGVVAVAAILRVSRIGTATAQSGGRALTLIIIAAVFLGGAILRGGKGTIFGSFLGVILIVILNNLVVILGLEISYSRMIIGSILIIIIIIDNLINKSVFKKDLDW